MNELACSKNKVYLEFNNLNLPKENLGLIISEVGKTPSLYTIVTTFYKYGIYQGLDYLYDNYNNELCKDYFMESVFLYLAKLGDEDKIEYFCKKSKSAIEKRDSFDRFHQFKEYEDKSIVGDEGDYSSPYYTPIFDEGLKALCTKKKAHILKELYSKGFKASLSQLKVATRTLNEDVFYVVFEELNSKVIADYVPMLVNELCYYSKLEPIQFLFEKIGADYITQDSLNKCLINSVNGHCKKSKLDIFKYILGLGANIKYNKYEVFEKVFGYGHADVLKFLYENNNEFENNKDYDLRKNVNIAIKYNKVEVIKYLIDTKKYINKDYNLMDDKVLIEEYCAQFNKNKEVLEYLIKKVFENDKEYINELKFKFPRQRKFQEFLNSLAICKDEEVFDLIHLL